MAEIISAVAPYVIAGSILPTWTLMIIVLLGTARPVANSLAFVAGNALFRLALGIAALFAFTLPVGDAFDLSSPAWDPRIVIVMGAALFVLGVLGFTRPRPTGDSSLLDRFERLSPVTALIAGLVTVASPGIQYVYFLGAISAIRSTVSGGAASLAALLIVVLLLQWMLFTPIAVYLVFRQRADAALRTVKSWLKRNGQRVGSGVLVAAGIYIAITGFGRL